VKRNGTNAPVRQDFETPLEAPFLVTRARGHRPSFAGIQLRVKRRRVEAKSGCSRQSEASYQRYSQLVSETCRPFVCQRVKMSNPSHALRATHPAASIRWLDGQEFTAARAASKRRHRSTRRISSLACLYPLPRPGHRVEQAFQHILRVPTHYGFAPASGPFPQRWIQRRPTDTRLQPSSSRSQTPANFDAAAASGRVRQVQSRPTTNTSP
jgi:hypothetical protein